MRVLLAMNANQRGTAIIGLAVILPAVLLLIFTAYRLGIETASDAFMEHKQQVLLNAQIQGSFHFGPDSSNSFFGD